MGRTLTVSIIERMDGVECSHSSVTMDIGKDGATVDEYANAVSRAVEQSWGDEAEYIMLGGGVSLIRQHKNFFDDCLYVALDEQLKYHKDQDWYNTGMLGVDALAFYLRFAPVGYDDVGGNVRSPFTGEYIEARLANATA